jgi:hypothetical protein
MEPTYKVVVIGSQQFGKAAATPDLAKLAAGDLPRDKRCGIEQTDWSEQHGRPLAYRTVLIEAESTPGEWQLGTEARE